VSKGSVPRPVNKEKFDKNFDIIFKEKRPMTDAYKLYRKGDPDTSKEAAEKISSTCLEQMVLNVIARFPEGVISDEVRSICDKEFNVTSYSSVTARYKALEEKGLITFAGKRAGKSGRGQRIMYITYLGHLNPESIGDSL
jgi:DNA-binding transcriptional ArsR family regulator